ncbi:Tetratricopeptide repeat-containing protein [Terribacillus halophilus]|uniref:Tetratricopeptide repeat-containing protein n=1 Tax=Terribacillus halophilus TaxID=361279 RepID=A0A1G6QKP9_9BACI|nr:tetratricopeptide repeat protein [Terribacillus halophilus]SDC93009.1 Tetratricopeptide repeat-containing protein [Terribacillus halophilus]
MSQLVPSKEEAIKFYNDNNKYGAHTVKEYAEQVLQEDPASPRGHFILGIYYLYSSQNEKAIECWNHAFSLAPTNLEVIDTYISYHRIANLVTERLKEVIDSSLQLYPDNPFLHYERASIFIHIDTEEAITSYKEAIRLAPQEADFSAELSILLNNLNREKEAEKYERLSLQADPEDWLNLKFFADIAYSRKKYKKALQLIEHAIRLAPAQPEVRESYFNIIQTRNPFTRTMFHIADILFIVPAGWLQTLFGKKIQLKYYRYFVMLLESIILFLLFGPYALGIIGVWTISLFIGRKLAKSEVLKSGITATEENRMMDKAVQNQQEAISELQATIQPRASQQKAKTLSEEELEKQLQSMWQEADITAVKNRRAQEKEHAAHVPASTQPVPYKEIKEYRRLPASLLIGAIMAAYIIVKFYPMWETKMNAVPVDHELQASITEHHAEMKEEQQAERLETTTQGSMDTAEQFLELVNGTDAGGVIGEDLAARLQENGADPLVDALKGATITKEIQPYQGLPISYVLLTNEAENMKAILEITGGKVLKIYAESWNETTEDQTKYNHLLIKMDE